MTSLHGTLTTCRTHTRPPAAWAVLLVCALLLAQWIGLQHSIVHAGWQQGAAGVGHTHNASNRSNSSGDRAGTFLNNFGGDNGAHSCASFDAACLGYAIDAALPPLPLLAPAHVLALWVAFASWVAPPILHFSSRAPPRI